MRARATLASTHTKLCCAPYTRTHTHKKKKKLKYNCMYWRTAALPDTGIRAARAHSSRSHVRAHVTHAQAGTARRSWSGQVRWTGGRTRPHGFSQLEWKETVSMSHFGHFNPPQLSVSTWYRCIPVFYWVLWWYCDGHVCRADWIGTFTALTRHKVFKIKHFSKENPTYCKRNHISEPTLRIKN